VTLPNLILAVLPDSQLSDAGSDLDLDDETLDAFFHRLEEHDIELQFSSGDWSGLAEDVEQRKDSYDLILTAETIYRPDSVPSLLQLLRAAAQVSVAESEDVVSEQGDEIVSKNSYVHLNKNECLTLIAAKVIYFGVGGDLHAFEAKVTDAGGKLEVVKAWNAGVGRKVLQLRW
jgi:protein-histidine N-methyltransferase